MKVIFFDLDDTLYFSEPVYASGLKKAWEKFTAAGIGLHPNPAREEKSQRSSSSKTNASVSFDKFKEAYAEARAQVKEAVGPSPSCHSRLLYFKKLVENFEGRSRPRLALELDQTYSEAWTEIPIAKFRTVLEALAQDYTLGVITNHLCITQLQKLEFLDPEEKIFRWIITSEEVGVEKPHPKIFHEALSRARCSPQEAVMVGDHWEADIEGARACGLKAIYISPDEPKRKMPEDVSWVRSLEELREVL